MPSARVVAAGVLLALPAGRPYAQRGARRKPGGAPHPPPGAAPFGPRAPPAASGAGPRNRPFWRPDIGKTSPAGVPILTGPAAAGRGNANRGRLRKTFITGRPSRTG